MYSEEQIMLLKKLEKDLYMAFRLHWFSCQEIGSFEKKNPLLHYLSKACSITCKPDATC